MNRMLMEKENDETVAYIVDRFLLAGLKYNQSLAITRTMTSEFEVSSEKAAEKLVKNYLTSLNHRIHIKKLLKKRSRLLNST